MIDPKVVNDTKVIFGPCRLSYTHVLRSTAQTETERASL